MRFDLSSAERATLLGAAREALERELAGGAQSSRPLLTSLLQAPSGAFVTLLQDGALRGCVGYTAATHSLYDTVLSSALKAAFGDGRFAPVAGYELESIRIEISVLEPSVPIDKWEDIIIGEHGIIMEKGGKSALFLPQVATQYGWDIETTLTHLAKKAGLGESDWRDGASFKVFRAIKFGDEE